MKIRLDVMKFLAIAAGGGPIMTDPKVSHRTVICKVCFLSASLKYKAPEEIEVFIAVDRGFEMRLPGLWICPAHQ